MATIIVSSGQVQTGATLGPGDVEFVLSGGTAIGTTVGSGAEQILSAGAIGSQVLVAGGGAEIVQGSLSLASIASGGLEYVSSGGMVTNSLVQSGGFDYVYDGGSTVSATVSGTEQIFSGGSAASVIDAGVQTVFQGGVATQTFVQTGGTQYVMSGGSVTSTAVDGGTQQVFAGASANSDIVGAGGTVLLEGGTLFTAVVQAGGAIDVSSGTTSATALQGTETLVGDGSISVRTAIAGGGVMSVGSGAFASATAIAAGGTEIVGYGGHSTQTFIGLGGVETVLGATAASGSASIGGVEINALVGKGGTLVVTGGAKFADPSADIPFATLLEGGTIDLRTVAFSSSETATINTTTDVLTLGGTAGGTTLQLAGSYNTEYFHVANDGHGGTDITVDGTPCYCRGTRVLTQAGEVAVEDLRVGDVLMTASGAVRPLRWIGTRAYGGRFAAGNADVLPVTIAASALADGVPARDLHVSPLHAMHLDGVLIPAAALVNGRSITQAEHVDQVEYFHLELDSHDVILAEGAACETFVDDDSRGMFHNAADYAARYPGAARRPAKYCAPRVEDGPALEAVRRRIAARVAPDTAMQCRGYLDRLTRERVVGWAIDDADPARRITVRIRDNGEAIGEAVASLPRDDLRDAGIGDGAHGFEFGIPGGLSPLARHVITAETIDGTPLHGELVLEPAAPLATPPDAAGTRVHGNVDLVSRERILGWAVDDADPQAAVAVQILVGGVLVASVLANRHRRDVAEARHGDGRHAFEHHFAPALSPLARHVVELRCEDDGARLGPPAILEPSTQFDAALEDAVAKAVAGLDVAERDHVLNFMLAQADRLRQQAADAQAGRIGRELARRNSRTGASSPADAPMLRALVIDAAMPDASRDAGSNAVLSHMRALQSLGYGVSFVAAEQMEATGEALEAARINACGMPFYASVEDVLRRQSGCFDLVYLHRAEIAEAYLALARRWMGGARIIYSVADLHHVRLARQAEAEDRPELLARSCRLRLAECTAAWSADAVLTHSPYEAALLRTAVPAANIHVVPWDVASRASETPRPSIPFSRRHGVGFVGNYGHGPNLDAARFLVEEVMPLVWARDPAIVCRLAGHGMTDAVKSLARPGVEILGHVPDLAILFDDLRLSVAPLRSGAGIKGKVLDSFAAGVPCVMTPIAAEGLALTAPLAALVANDAAGLAGAIMRLHADAAAHRAAATAGRALIRRDNSQAKVTDALREAIRAAGGVLPAAVA